VGRFAGLTRRGLVPWLLVGALTAALVVAIVQQRSTASDRDRTAARLNASRAALARATAQLENVQMELHSTRIELRRTRSMLAAPRRALLQDRRFQIAFLRGSYPDRGLALVLASLDGTIERTLLDVADLRAEVLVQGAPMHALNSSCQPSVVFSVSGVELLESGQLRLERAIECPPSAHGGTTLVNNGIVFARHGKTEKKLFAVEMGHSFRDWITLSPDGKRVAFALSLSGSRGVQVMNTRTRQQLAVGRSLPDYWLKTNLVWAPDSRRIAITLRPPDVGELGFSPPKPPAWLDGAKEAVVIIDRRGRILARVPNAGDAAWSRDGRMIAFESSRSGHRDVYVANADGSGVRRVTHASQASWSPNWR
jgi:hypothetical protein